MAKISKLLDDHVASLAESGLKKLGRYGIVANRLKIILIAKEHGITEVCRVHGISRTTVTDSIKRLSSGGSDALVNKPKKPQVNITDIKKFFRIFVNVTVVNPEFSSQSKTEMVSPE